MPLEKPTDSREYNWSAIRDLIEAAFSGEEFGRFCMDRPTFRPLLSLFPKQASLAQMIDVTLGYCHRKLYFPEFFHEIQKVNPRQFAMQRSRLYSGKESSQSSAESPVWQTELDIGDSWPAALPRVADCEPQLLLVPDGQFVMGSEPKRGREIHADERPQHRLWLPNYYISQTPVTNQQYADFVHAAQVAPPEHWIDLNPPPGREDHPVVNVSWYDAVAYCCWLSEITDRPYRLPSEAEWEKGARGSHGRNYPWGVRWGSNLCNTWEAGTRDTTAVAEYPKGASPYGLLDTVGNVREWTVSLWGEGFLRPEFGYPYKADDGREDERAPGFVYRVLRGCGFSAPRQMARCTLRDRMHPDVQSNLDVGFRVVVSTKE